jgi:hypothetical protein
VTRAISIVLPTIRPAGLPMVLGCLRRQTVGDWELYISTPNRPGMTDAVNAALREALAPGQNHEYQSRIYLTVDPPKAGGDLYALNKAWNNLVRHSQSDRLLFLTDWVWFPDDTLARFLAHPADVGVSSTACHYRHVLGGRPEGRWWTDPRLGKPFHAAHMELVCAMLPRPKLLEVGGFDEAYDRVAGLSEKEACLRMHRAGCRFVLDENIRVRMWTHPKPEFPDWDGRYAAACDRFSRDTADVLRGHRLVVSNPMVS